MKLSRGLSRSMKSFLFITTASTWPSATQSALRILPAEHVRYVKGHSHGLWLSAANSARHTLPAEYATRSIQDNRGLQGKGASDLIICALTSLQENCRQGHVRPGQRLTCGFHCLSPELLQTTPPLCLCTSSLARHPPRPLRDTSSCPAEPAPCLDTPSPLNLSNQSVFPCKGAPSPAQPLP